ncbi:MAG: porin [Rickettsiales bacterium]|nr:porin [Rickettsiales bacterium]
MLKKISTLTTLAILCSNMSFADKKLCSFNTFDILVGGEFNAELGGRVQSGKYTKADTGILSGGSASNVISKQGVTANNKNLGMDSFASAHATVQNMSNSNFSYGAHVGIKTTTRSNERSGESELDRSYVFAQGEEWGKFELGSNEGAANAMAITGTNTDVGKGTWEKYVSLNTYASSSNFQTLQVRGSNFLTSARLALEESTYETNHEAFRKVTYYTPKINGFQVGLSYIPDATNKGGNAVYPNQNNTQEADTKNAFSGGITWGKSFAKNHNINIALVGEIGQKKSASASAPDTQKGLFHRSEAFILGAKYVKDKMSMALAYGNRGKTGFKKNITKDSSSGVPITPGNSYFWNLGGAYELTTKTTTSLTYLHSVNNKNTLDVIYLGADYKITNGLKTYAETSYFKGTQKRDYNAATLPIITTNQKFKITGGTIITGIQVTF